MSDVIEARVQKLVQEIIAVHLNLFPALLANRGASLDEQRQRLDTLVRALGRVAIRADLSEAGKAVPFAVDAQAEPPAIAVHAGLVAQVDDEALFQGFRRPIATILGLTELEVGLVLGLSDAASVQALRATAGVREETRPRPVEMTSIPAVVEARVSLFEARLGALARGMSDAGGLTLSGGRAFVERLLERSSGWPEWSSIQSDTYLKAAIVALEEACSGAEDSRLDPVIAGELCWQSLDLSAQSSLRQAARRLRGLDAADPVGILSLLAEAVGHEEQDISTWTAFSEVADAWRALLMEEQRSIAVLHASSRAPKFSVFDPPKRTLRLNEPESLPWDQPFLAWTQREQRALRDLLTGFRRMLEEEGVSSLAAARDEPSDLDDGMMEVDSERSGFEVQLSAASATPEQAPPDLVRAICANERRMLAQFERLDAASQKRAVSTLRAAYGGFIGHARGVWKRRFQAIHDLPCVEGFGVLLRELGAHLGDHIFFDPFESPTGAVLRMIPTFAAVAALDETGGAPVSLPLVTLRNANHDMPVRVRVIDARGGAPRWLADVPVTMDTLRGARVDAVIKSIERDRVALMVQDRG